MAPVVVGNKQCPLFTFVKAFKISRLDGLPISILLNSSTF